MNLICFDYTDAQCQNQVTPHPKKWLQPRMTQSVFVHCQLKKESNCLKALCYIIMSYSEGEGKLRLIQKAILSIFHFIQPTKSILCRCTDSASCDFTPCHGLPMGCHSAAIYTSPGQREGVTRGERPAAGGWRLPPNVVCPCFALKKKKSR